MAISTTAALLITAAITTATTMYAQDTQSKQAESNLKFQADQQNADAEAQKGAAFVEAQRIRKAAAAQRAQATAAAAASGVDVESPTAVRLNEEISKNGEEDALTTMLNGGDAASRMKQQASISRTGASLARSEGRQQQAATLISGIGQMANYGQGWKRAPTGGG